MPILFVYGINPRDYQDQERLGVFCEELKEVVAGVPELKISPELVTCFFPGDNLKAGLGEEIVILVEGLFTRPERTPDVREKLAQAIVCFTRRFFPKTILAECFVQAFDPAMGFASSAKSG